MNEKKMSLVDLVFMGMGGCIGAGIFSMLGVGVGYTGRSVALAFLIAMLFKMSQNVRTIVMSSMFSMSGGMYSQTGLIITPLLTGVNALMAVVGSFTFAVFGISLASYTVLLVPALVPFEKFLAAAWLLLFTVLAATGVNLFAKVQNLLGISKIVTLGMFIVFGLFAMNHGGFEGEPYFIGGGINFITAIALMSFTCDGIAMIVNVAPMAENPKRNIPKAWVIASLACALIYALLGYVASGLAPHAEGAYQNLGYFAQMVLPKPLYLFFIVGGAMASLSTALLGGLIGQAPQLQGIAQDGWIPKLFNNRNVVLAVLCGMSIVTVFTGLTLDNIVSMTMVPSMVLGILTNLRAMKLPEQYPTEWANKGFNLSPSAYRGLMVLSIIASALTGYFSLTSLTLPLAIGTVFATAFLFIYSNYMIKSGKIDITSTTDLG